LTAVEIPTYQLKPREDDPGSDIPGIRLGTIKRIKGLEFRAVALVCADPNDPMNKLGQAALLEKCERYVATTRAREHLLVTVSP
jgi:superfamily I DNA/RNA helicase